MNRGTGGVEPPNPPVNSNPGLHSGTLPTCASRASILDLQSCRRCIGIHHCIRRSRVETISCIPYLGIFPSSFKQALVQPLLKKPSLSTDDLNNFRPISNLNFISKILEKVVASRIQSHLSSNSLSSSFQSAYRIFHSTETTLLKIHNDLILAMDRGEVTSLILLDLSAAFGTVDHSILLTRLQNWFGLDGLSLNWFTSYLSSRSQAVSINDSISAFSTLSCGVPQGPVLGPLLFTLYTTPLGSVISKNSLKYHLYADDTQLYISFTPTNSALCLETLTTTFH